MRRALTLVLAIALIAIVIIGFVNFDLFLLIWVRVLIAVLLIGASVAIVRMLFHFR